MQTQYSILEPLDTSLDCSPSREPPPAPAPLPGAPVNNDAPPRVHVPESITCRTCGAIGAPVVGPGAGQHVARALCRACGAFVTWLSRYSPEEKHERRRLAGWQAMCGKEATPAQLAYLHALGYRGDPPADRAAASALIDQLEQERRL